MKIYKDHIQKYESKRLELTEALKSLSAFRLVVFIFSLVIITFLANGRSLALIIIVAPLFVLGFGLLVNRYSKVNYLKRHATFLKEVNENEVLKFNHKLSDFETGQAYIDLDHPFILDLDIFGQHSLFQLINRTTTDSASALLATWLSVPASNETILERQDAIKELVPKLDWRQHFQALGMHYRNAKSDDRKLLTWVEMPVQLLPQHLRYLTIGITLSLLSTLAAVYYLFHAFASDFFIYLIPLIIILIVNSLVLRRVKPIAEEIIENTYHNVKTLEGYRARIAEIESERFESKALKKLRSVLTGNHYSAANEINKLKKILEICQLRGTKKESISRNLFYGIFNTFWLLDIYWILLAEKWKLRNRSNLQHWVAALAEFEVLNSLAGFHYSNPLFTFPEILKQPYAINFETLGHPLISPEKRICNNFNLEGQGNIAMITGSNMAGKSTFLRTVGVNLVLALIGAPCCAKFGQVSNMKIFSSMRTQDNLEAGISSFYAELKRIEQLLQLIEDKKPVFFLLDEMFKGTNSEDRHKGGFSLIKQLGELNAFGIISTHDLELAKLAGKHQIVNNYSFNSEIQEEEMTFNYKLTKGICKDFNASELMKRSGIKILPTIEKM